MAINMGIFVILFFLTLCHSRENGNPGISSSLNTTGLDSLLQGNDRIETNTKIPGFATWPNKFIFVLGRETGDFYVFKLCHLVIQN